MDLLSKLHYHLRPPHLPLNPSRPSFPLNPIPSRALKRSPLALALAASSSPNIQTPKNLQALISPILKTTSITLTAAAALFLSRIHLNPAIALSFPAATSSPEKESSTENILLAERERAIEDILWRNPRDTLALRALVEVKIKSRKLLEAIKALDRLIELEPGEEDLPLLRSKIYRHSGDLETARKGFEGVLETDPCHVAAYRGLILANAEEGNSLKELTSRIEAAMDKCRSEKRYSELREFRLLIGQIRTIEEKYGDALRVYEELVKEEPRDFRPYLCQAVVYTLMRKRDEAVKKFEECRKLVPEDHPYLGSFFDNLFASKLFTQKGHDLNLG